MAELKLLGVMQPIGYTAEHGTRVRMLQPEALRLRESGTPGLRESGTEELLKRKQSGRLALVGGVPDRAEAGKKTEEDAPLAKGANGARSSQYRSHISPEDKAFLVLRSQRGDDEARALMSWLMVRAAAAGTKPESFLYYVRAAENFYAEQEYPEALLEKASQFTQADIDRARERADWRQFDKTGGGLE